MTRAQNIVIHHDTSRIGLSSLKGRAGGGALYNAMMAWLPPLGGIDGVVVPWEG